MLDEIPLVVDSPVVTGTEYLAQAADVEPQQLALACYYASYNSAYSYYTSNPINCANGYLCYSDYNCISDYCSGNYCAPIPTLGWLWWTLSCLFIFLFFLACAMAARRRRQQMMMMQNARRQQAN